MSAGRTLGVVGLLLVAAPAWGQSLTPSDPGSLRPRDQPGALTVQGKDASAREAPSPVPLAVSATASLIFTAGGLVLTIPELSLNHVLGFSYEANRTRGYLGLGALTLAPAVALALSGGRATTAVAGSLIEAVAIGAAFGFAYVSDIGLRGSLLTKVLVGGLPLVLTGIAAIGSIVFPIFIAFTNGAQLDAEEDASDVPSVGFQPTPGGVAVVFAWRL